MKISVRWLSCGPDIAAVIVSAGNATLEEQWLNEDECKELATHFREVADELYPLEQIND